MDASPPANETILWQGAKLGAFLLLQLRANVATSTACLQSAAALYCVVMRRLIAIAIALTGLHLICHAEPRRWALVVGIDKYDDPGLTSLNFAAEDAKLIAKALEGLHFERIVSLTSDSTDPELRPTKANILQRLVLIEKDARPEDTIVFYFSGHGFSGDDGSCYLSTQDCRVGLFEDTALSAKSLESHMRRVLARQRVLIIDACRVSPYKDGKGDPNVRTRAFSASLVELAQSSDDPEVGGAVLWACSLGEQSWEEPTKRHGVFTFFLAEGIANGLAAGEDGAITPYSMITHTQEQMQAWSLKSGKRQTPAWTPTGRAKLVIGQVAPRPPAPPQFNGLVGLERINPRTGSKMVYVPGGSFTLGDSALEYDDAFGGGPNGLGKHAAPAHKVSLSPYWIGRNLVTVAEFRAFCDATKFRFNWDACRPVYGWMDNHPMVNVTWDEARDYALWAGGELPTESQWEFAARGPNSLMFPWGNEWDGAKCWSSVTSAKSSTAAVGSYPAGASPFQVLDMCGNAAQWCLDTLCDYVSGPEQDPIHLAGDPEYRITRGGNWRDTQVMQLRSPHRPNCYRHNRNDNLGFRIVLKRID